MDAPDEATTESFLRAAVRGQVPPGEVARRIEADPVTPLLRGLGFEPDPARRLEDFRTARHLCPATVLEAAGFEVRARISRAELWRFYLPLCALLRAGGAHRAGRMLVGVTGPGAAGKTVFAHLLRRVHNVTNRRPAGRAAVCPLDGFHYPNVYLDSHESPGPDGRPVTLRTVKGSPPTFDAAGFVEKLRALRADPTVTMPVYDRRLHDPVQDALSVGPSDRVVIVEGNYLLLQEGDWAPVRGLLDLVLFIETSLEAARDAMIRRHVRGGRSPEEARRYYECVDRPNYELIMATRPRADLVVRRGEGQRVVAVTAG